jgi:hypothetical protein
MFDSHIPTSVLGTKATTLQCIYLKSNRKNDIHKVPKYRVTFYTFTHALAKMQNKPYVHNSFLDSSRNLPREIRSGIFCTYVNVHCVKLLNYWLLPWRRVLHSGIVSDCHKGDWSLLVVRSNHARV